MTKLLSSFNYYSDWVDLKSEWSTQRLPSSCCISPAADNCSAVNAFQEGCEAKVGSIFINRCIALLFYIFSDKLVTN